MEPLAITKTHPDFQAVQFVTEAADLKRPGDCASLVQVTDKHELAATDGYSLHVAAKCSLPAGLYHIERRTKTLVILRQSDKGTPFPKWQDIVPQQADRFTPNHLRPCASICATLGAIGLAIDPDRVGAVLRHIDIFEATVYVPAQDEDGDRPISPISLVDADKGFTAVIMPFEADAIVAIETPGKK